VMRLTGWILFSLTLMPMAGCASLTDFHYEQTQRSRARAAWHEHGVATTPAAYARDYRAGWKDGFYDVATGGKGCPPVVAPCHYWKPSQILEDRDQARHAYYSGFQDGVAAALQYPQTHYLKLWSSCECPLPVCENRCCPTPACCPGEVSGLIYEDGIPGAMEYIVPVNEPIPVDDQVNRADEESTRIGEAIPANQPDASVSTETGNAPRTIGVEAAQPYHFEASLIPWNWTPAEYAPVAFPGSMIEEDLGSVAPCNVLQYAP
jgi:hypothetical protein